MPGSENNLVKDNNKILKKYFSKKEIKELTKEWKTYPREPIGDVTISVSSYADSDIEQIMTKINTLHNNIQNDYPLLSKPGIDFNKEFMRLLCANKLGLLNVMNISSRTEYNLLLFINNLSKCQIELLCKEQRFNIQRLNEIKNTNCNEENIVL